eukprot:Em0020g820a
MWFFVLFENEDSAQMLTGSCRIASHIFEVCFYGIVDGSFCQERSNTRELKSFDNICQEYTDTDCAKKNAGVYFPSE